MNKLTKKISMPEFFNLSCISAVLLFALNNHYLKSQYANWLTGKLSDITVCFFLPLFISAITSLLVDWSLKKRLQLGCIITAIFFTSVKISPWASGMLNSVLSFITSSLGFGESINRIDLTDLIALPMILLAYYFGVNQEKINSA